MNKDLGSPNLENLSLYDQVKNGVTLQTTGYIQPLPVVAVPNQIPIFTPFKDMKFDEGKLLAHIIFEDFPDAIKEVIRVATFGAKKYERSSWKTVTNGLQRYSDAKARHFLEAAAGVELDEESGLDHLAHEAWNALATLQLKLETKKNKNV